MCTDRRRSFRFSLRALGVVMTALCVATAWITWNWQRVQLRRETRSWLDNSHSGSVLSRDDMITLSDRGAVVPPAAAEAPRGIGLLGEPSAYIIFHGGLSPEQLDRVRTDFPEARLVKRQ